MNKIKLLWNKFWSIFDIMAKKGNSIFSKIILGHTRTKQVSGASKRIVFDKELSAQVYSKMDSKHTFQIESKKTGEKYTVRRVKPSF